MFLGVDLRSVALKMSKDVCAERTRLLTWMFIRWKAVFSGSRASPLFIETRLASKGIGTAIKKGVRRLECSIQKDGQLSMGWQGK